jgi:hypothetical protein
MTTCNPKKTDAKNKVKGGNGNGSRILVKRVFTKIRNYSCTQRSSGDPQWLLTPQHMVTGR